MAAPGKISLHSMAQTGLLTAMTAVLSLIAIPLPSGIPLTLQTFAVALCGFLGGVRKALPAVCIYLMLGAVGVPVFSGFRGGPGVLLGITGGFLWGFLPLAILCGMTANPDKKNTISRALVCILCSLSGLLLCHLCGILQYMAVSRTGLHSAFITSSLPFLWKDVLLLCAAWGCAAAIKQALRANRIRID